MRSLKAIIGAAAALALAAVLVVGHGAIAEWAHRARAFVRSFADRAFSYGEMVRLRTENEALRAERAALLEAGIPPFSADLMKVPVYSRYPYGAGGALVIAAGSAQGLREGLPVLAAPGVLLGKITRVERTRSEVMTIFHRAWRSSVRAEGGNAHALLEGGETPRVSLIPEGEILSAGTRIVSVDGSFPFGLFIGAAARDAGEADGPWRAALLAAPYRESDLREVLVVTNFP